MFDFHVGQPSYLDHLLGLWKALQPTERGAFGASTRSLVTRLAREGITSRPVGRAPVLVVAGASDIALGRRTGQRIVLVNHGAGQTYAGDSSGARNPSYSGGDGREEVALFLCPNQADADLNLARYPTSRAVVVGAPKLETLPRPPEHSDVVCISFHWDARFCPEARWAWPHYARSLRTLAEQMPLIGHAHPRAIERIAPWYRRAGIEVMERFEDVCKVAGSYCVDNSSTGPEFAALGGRVVWLDAPWYRRNVQHGGRFWDWLDWAPVATGPDDVAACVAEAAKPEWVTRRADGTARIYSQIAGATQASLEALRLELAQATGNMAS